MPSLFSAICLGFYDCFSTICLNWYQVSLHAYLFLYLYIDYFSIMDGQILMVMFFSSIPFLMLLRFLFLPCLIRELIKFSWYILTWVCNENFLLLCVSICYTMCYSFCKYWTIYFHKCIRYPLKAVKVMHIVALRTESSLQKSTSSPSQSAAYKVHMRCMYNM